MKRVVLLPVLVALLLSFSATAARAAAFTLTMIDLSPDCAVNCVVTVADATVSGTNDSSLALDRIKFTTGTVGRFTVQPAFGTTLFGINGIPIDMNLAALTVSAPTSGTFRAILYHTDLSLVGTTAQANIYSGFNLNGYPATVDFATRVDSLNLTSGAVFDLPPSPGMFALYSKVDIVFQAAGVVSAFTDVQITNPVSTPEPGTMMLFGAGVLGLASFGRRRSKNKCRQVVGEAL